MGREKQGKKDITRKRGKGTREDYQLRGVQNEQTKSEKGNAKIREK